MVTPLAQRRPWKLARETVTLDRLLAVAAHLEAAGLRAGAPRVTRMGELSIAMADAQVAVLPFIAGRAIDPTNPSEQQLWGATLGRAHCLLRRAARPAGVMEWHWVDVMAAHLDVQTAQQDHHAHRIPRRNGIATMTRNRILKTSSCTA
jgi:hypothetical protein